MRIVNRQKKATRVSILLFFYNREINHINKFKYADNYLTKTVVFRHLRTELLFEYALTFHQGEKFWLHNAILLDKNVSLAQFK